MICHMNECCKNCHYAKSVWDHRVIVDYEAIECDDCYDDNKTIFCKMYYWFVYSDEDFVKCDDYSIDAYKRTMILKVIMENEE